MTKQKTKIKPKKKVGRPEVGKGQTRVIWENQICQLKKVIFPGKEREYKLVAEVFGMVDGEPVKAYEETLTPATQRSVEHNLDIIAFCDGDIAEYISRLILERQVKGQKQSV